MNASSSPTFGKGTWVERPNWKQCSGLFIFLGIVAFALPMPSQQANAQSDRISIAPLPPVDRTSVALDEITPRQFIEKYLILRRRMKFADYRVHYWYSVRGEGFTGDDLQLKDGPTEHKIDFTNRQAVIDARQVVEFKESKLLPGHFFDVRSVGMNYLRPTVSSPDFGMSSQDWMETLPPWENARLERDVEGKCYLFFKPSPEKRITLVFHALQSPRLLHRLVENGKTNRETGEFQALEVQERIDLEWARCNDVDVPSKYLGQALERYRPFGPPTEPVRKRLSHSILEFEWVSANKPIDLSDLLKKREEELLNEFPLLIDLFKP